MGSERKIGKRGRRNRPNKESKKVWERKDGEVKEADQWSYRKKGGGGKQSKANKQTNKNREHCNGCSPVNNEKVNCWVRE